MVPNRNSVVRLMSSVMAVVLMGSNVVYYLPVLIVSGTIAGVGIGLVAAILVKRIPVD